MRTCVWSWCTIMRHRRAWPPAVKCSLASENSAQALILSGQPGGIKSFFFLILMSEEHNQDQSSAWRCRGNICGLRPRLGRPVLSGDITCLPRVRFVSVTSRSFHTTLTVWNISGPGNDQLDLNKLISPGVRALVHLTENIKHVQGLFHLVDIQRGF